MSEHPPQVPVPRQIFCNRTLNLRSIQAIGYDMDYTLVHYHTAAWEGRAYDHMKQRLAAAGWPVDGLEFDPTLVTRGLVIDVALGNIVKANRFGYVKQAMHGTKQLEYHQLRRAYARTLVDLGEPRWAFLNTLFSISEACMYAQLVELLDAGKIEGAMGYDELYQQVRAALDAAHVEGELKREIMAQPERFVAPDPQTALALIDQKHAGKHVLLITNSEWEYTRFMLDFAIEPYLPDGMSWKELFDLTIVSARKPPFFLSQQPIFEVVNDEGLLRPVVGGLKKGGIYLGGHAGMVEACFGLDGEQILYVGDHIYGDVNVSKSILRWRTALILREMEQEMEAIEASRETQAQINALMAKKVELEDRMSQVRLKLQRLEKGYGPPVEAAEQASAEGLRKQMTDYRQQLIELDGRIGPLVAKDGAAFNDAWGYLLRAGNDKSHLTRQLERYADIYTSRVSNLAWYTPFMYFRSPRGSLPHDHGA